MKKKHKLTYQIVFTLLFSINALGQKIVEDKVDDFTGDSILKTSWETINMSNKFTAYCRISKINKDFFFDLKLMIGGTVFSIDEKQNLMFKLDNDEIITLSNLKYSITCNGCGAKGIIGSQIQGIMVSYPINKEKIIKLKKYNTLKIRIYTNDGYVENELKSKHSKRIKKTMSLLEF